MPDTTRLTTALGGRYAIERELGAGGMATVYLARDLKHDREVALKVLRPELFAVLGSERFLAEIKITARLDHPHILTLIDSGAVDGFLYYVLPYVRGESLRARLEREKQLGIDEALGITRQIASALDYAHQHGVVHRDIKPENILLHEGEAVLADFGIALAVKEAGGNRLTETGLSLGTPQYMSPEQATGDRTLDARSDVYSLAAVLYEMLAGEPPVTGATAQAMIAKLMTERPTRIRTVRDTVPEGIDNAIAKALAKVPADRFASAGQFVQELAAGSRPSRSSAPLPAARRRGGLVVVVATFAVITAAVVVTQSRRGERVRVVQPDRQQVTFTGNARIGALSPDGQRLAYSARRCTAAGYCTVDVIVQDVGGAGSSTVLSDWAAFWEIDWSGDGRYLVVNGFQGLSGNWGPFVVPALGGGPARFLGCCDANMGFGDTAVVTGGSGGDSLLHVRLVTVSDGITRDSLTIRRTAGGRGVAFQLPGGRLLVRRDDPGVNVALVVERRGRIVDSLRVEYPLFEIEGPSRNGRALLAREWLASAGEFNLLAYRIDENGRIRRTADTVMRQVQGDFIESAGGLLANSAGPSRYEVWMMQRSSPLSMQFTQRRLAASTALMGGLINQAGDRVIMFRRVVQGGRPLSQLSVMPADSGAEVLLGPPLDLRDWEWTEDGQALAIALNRGDSIDIALQPMPGGRRQNLGTLPRRHFEALWALPGGGVVILEPTGSTIRLMGRPGQRDTLFEYPETQGYITGLDASPDGRDLVTVGWEKNGDSIVVQRISLADGQARRLAVFYADGASNPVWLPDGTLILPIRETGSTLVWYRMPATGGRSQRMGTPPRSEDASFRMSADGRRVVARVNSPSPDVYLVRNFAELLPR